MLLQHCASRCGLSQCQVKELPATLAEVAPGGQRMPG
jgi:hypothetical protein